LALEAAAATAAEAAGAGASAAEAKTGRGTKPPALYIKFYSGLIAAQDIYNTGAPVDKNNIAVSFRQDFAYL
jgi:hypothetical protein